MRIRLFQPPAGDWLAGAWAELGNSELLKVVQGRMFRRTSEHFLFYNLETANSHCFLLDIRQMQCTVHYILQKQKAAIHKIQPPPHYHSTPPLPSNTTTTFTATTTFTTTTTITTTITIHATTSMTRPRQKASTGNQSWQDGNKDLDLNIYSQLH